MDSASHVTQTVQACSIDAMRKEILEITEAICAAEARTIAAEARTIAASEHTLAAYIVEVETGARSVNDHIVARIAAIRAAAEDRIAAIRAAAEQRIAAAENRITAAEDRIAAAEARTAATMVTIAAIEARITTEISISAVSNK